MFNSKIASLEARIARLESSMTKKASLSGNTPIQMIDARTKKVETVDTLSSFYVANAEDDEVIDALNQLKSGKASQVPVATGQGFFILKVAGANKKAFLSGNTIIQMIDPITKRIEAQDTLSSFFLSNSDDEEVTEALVQLRSGKVSELQVATGQGYYILRVARHID
jgi:predicted transcriptional regulator